MKFQHKIRQNAATTAAVATAVLTAASLIAPQSAEAQSSDTFKAIADLTPPSAVKKGTPMKAIADYAKQTNDSGLKLTAPPAEAGKLMAEVPLAPSVGLASAAKQLRYSYSTINQHGKVATATAAVFLPKGEAPKGGWPIMAWAHGTVGLADQCAPSVNARSDRDQRYLNRWLQEGYAVVAADYVGLGTPGLMAYLDGNTTARSVTDAVITARRTSVGDQLANKWAVIGQSQGGGAALHVAHKATANSKAAGLDFRGTIATGAPAYIEELVIAGGPTFPPAPMPAAINAYTAYILAGFRDTYPQYNIDSALTPEGKKMVDAAETTCLGELTDALKGTNVARMFTKPLRTFPGLETALRTYMGTPTTGYDRPVFLGHGMKDFDVPTPIGMALNSEMWLNQFTGAAGSSGGRKNVKVEVHWYDTDHGATVDRSLTDSVPFARQIMR